MWVDGLTAALRRGGITAVHIAESLNALKDIVARANAAQPCLLLIGSHLPTEEGFAACRWAFENGLRKIIFSSACVADRIFVEDAPRMGVSALLPVEVNAEQLLQTVASVLTSDNTRPADIALGEVHLSPRELDIVRLWAEGKTDRQVAQALTLSTVTVRNHAQRILVRLNVHNRKDVIHRVRHYGLI